MLKKLVFTMLLFMPLVSVFAQGKKDLKISLATGAINSKYYVNATPGQFYNFGFEYQSNSRHSIATDYISGQFQYYDSINPFPYVSLTSPGNQNYTNVDARSSIFSVIYKYKFLEKKKLSMKAGIGIGLINETNGYIISTSPSSETFVRYGNRSNLCFPLRLDLDYQVSKFFQIGIIAGTYVYPDYPLVGEHLGLRVSYILK